MITSDVQVLTPGNDIKLYELDMTNLGGDKLRFHGYKELAPIVWQGETFEPWSIVANGFEKDGSGRLPAPTLIVGNIGYDDAGNALPGVITSLCRIYDDLVGARLIRHRTLSQYLDAVNFPEGNPTANPSEHMVPEIWIVECKTQATSLQVEFEMRSALDFSGQKLPSRQILANSCAWLARGGYRGPYCGYTGSDMFDLDDNPVTDPTKDRCAGRLASCKLRHGEFNELPFGGQPSADLIRG